MIFAVRSAVKLSDVSSTGPSSEQTEELGGNQYLNSGTFVEYASTNFSWPFTVLIG